MFKKVNSNEIGAQVTGSLTDYVNSLDVGLHICYSGTASDKTVKGVA